jgi:hypothetical protein
MRLSGLQGCVSKLGNLCGPGKGLPVKNATGYSVAKVNHPLRRKQRFWSVNTEIIDEFMIQS